MIQNQMTTSGTLFSIRREPSLPGAGVYVIPRPLLGHSDRSLTKPVLGASQRGVARFSALLIRGRRDRQVVLRFRLQARWHGRTSRVPDSDRGARVPDAGGHRCGTCVLCAGVLSQHPLGLEAPGPRVHDARIRQRDFRRGLGSACCPAVPASDPGHATGRRQQRLFTDWGRDAGPAGPPRPVVPLRSGLGGLERHGDRPADSPHRSGHPDRLPEPARRAVVRPSHAVHQLELRRTGWSRSTRALRRRTRTVPMPRPYNLYFTPDGKTAVVMIEQHNTIRFADAHTFHTIKDLRTPVAAAPTTPTSRPTVASSWCRASSPASCSR